MHLDIGVLHIPFMAFPIEDLHGMLVAVDSVLRARIVDKLRDASLMQVIDLACLDDDDLDLLLGSDQAEVALARREPLI